MILVTGVTGKTGGATLRALGERGIAVRALVRDPKRAAALEAPGVELVQGSFEDAASLERALEGVERAYLVSPPRREQPAQHRAFIQAARRAGVKHIVRLSGVGADAGSPLELARMHGSLEKELEDSGIAFTHLRPTSFMQNFLAFAGSIRGEGRFYGCGGEGATSLIDARDIGAVAAACLSEPGHEGQAYVLTGGEALTNAQAAAELSAALGRKVVYVDVPPEAVRAGMVSMGLEEWLADSLVWIEVNLVRRGLAAAVSPAVEQILGRKPIRFAQFARDFAAAF